MRACLGQFSIRGALGTRATFFPRSILHLPPEARTILLRQRAAPFHASARRNEASEAVQAFNWLEHICYDFANGIHGALGGLPWAYAIPLTAVAVRLVLLPNALANRSAQQRYLNIQPLLQAWLVKNKHIIYLEHAHNKDANFLRRTLAKAQRQRKEELVERWACGWFKRTSNIFISLPIFFSIMEVFRRMAGLDQMFFSQLINRIVPERVDSAVISAWKKIAGVGPDAQSVVEQSFATEGMLWFPNLMVPDPTGYLSGIVMGLNVANVWWSSRKSRRARGGSRINKIQGGFRVVVMGVMVLIYPLTLNMPAALLLYWGSSSAITLAQHMLLDIFRPLRAPAFACKRKARIPISMNGAGG
jgi:mitochondrial inner membrane protein COX18